MEISIEQYWLSFPGCHAHTAMAKWIAVLKGRLGPFDDDPQLQDEAFLFKFKNRGAEVIFFQDGSVTIRRNFRNGKTIRLIAQGDRWRLYSHDVRVSSADCLTGAEALLDRLLSAEEAPSSA